MKTARKATRKISLFHSPAGDRPFTALSLLLFGVMVLACQDSLVKFMSSETSFWQFQTLRAIGNLSFVTLLAMVSGGIWLIIPRNPGPVFLRAVLMMICMFFFFAGSPYLTFPQMAAGLYTYPIFVSMLAGPVLGERVGGWRIGALGMGIVGAGFILNPWDDEFTSLQILPVLAGFMYALNILTIRKLCRNESPLALAFAVALGFGLSGIIGSAALALFPLSADIQNAMPFIAIGWPELTLTIVGFAVLASLLNLTGNICMSRAYQTADSSWLAPVDFSYLLFAAIWSKVLFDQWPTTQAIIGMSLIAIAGGVTAWREKANATDTARKLARQTELT